MLIKRVFTVIALVSISACSNTPKLPAIDQIPPANEVHVTKLDRKQVKKETPSTHIEADVLYMLLVAEIAGQRQQFGIALDGYLEAAKRVEDPKIAERATKIALYLKQNAKAEEAVALWLDKDSGSLSARKMAIVSALRTENAQAAEKHINFLLQADPAGFESALIDIVKLMAQEGKAELVFAVLEKVSQLHPKNATVFYVQAYLAMQQEDIALAQKKIQYTLQLQPDWTKAIVFNAQLAMLSGDMDKAKSILQDAVEKLPENNALLKLLAQIYLKTADYEMASEVFRKIIEKNPGDSESSYSLALILLQLRDDDGAKIILEKLVEQPRWQSQASFYIGRIEARKKNNEDALIWFDKVTSGSLMLEAKISAFSVLVTMDKFSAAEQRLQEMRGLFPEDDVSVILLEAELLSKQKRYQEAFDLLTENLVKKPDNKKLLYSRALIAERLDKLDVLESDLKYILEIKPDDANALNALGYTLVDRTDRLQEAEQYLTKAIELQPNEPIIMDSYGWLQFKLGKLELALDYLQSAYNKKQENEIAAHLIEVLWLLDKKQAAQELFESALEGAPEDEYLLELKERIKGLN